MKKILAVSLLAQLLFTGVPSIFGASDRCVVTKTEGNTVVLKCSKQFGNFKVNDKVKVKSNRTKKIDG